MDERAINSPAVVTVVIAAYGSRPEHLTAALRSVLAQSLTALEVIVSDDSPDHQLATLVEAENDPRVRYRHNAPPLGAARNHWTCFRDATTPFLAIVNHDDLVAPRFLERLIAPLEVDATLAVAFCDHWVIDVDGHVLPAETDRMSATWKRSTLAPGAHRPFFTLLADQTIPMAMGAVFRRSLLSDNLPDDVGGAYDLYLTYLLCRSGMGAYYVPDRLSSWRIHPSSVTASGSQAWALGATRCWRDIAADPRLTSIAAQARRKAAIACYACARHARLNGRRLECLRWGLQSLALAPSWRGAAACALPFMPLSVLARS